MRKSTPKWSIHSTEICARYCKQCNTSICALYDSLILVNINATKQRTYLKCLMARKNAGKMLWSKQLLWNVMLRFVLLVCLWFFVPPENFSTYGDVTIVGERLQMLTYARQSCSLSSERSFLHATPTVTPWKICHTSILHRSVIAQYPNGNRSSIGRYRSPKKYWPLILVNVGRYLNDIYRMGGGRKVIDRDIRKFYLLDTNNLPIAICIWELSHPRMTTRVRPATCLKWQNKTLRTCIIYLIGKQKWLVHSII